MEQQIIEMIRTLRSDLHRLAEPSGGEKRTKSLLMEFLRNHTSLKLEDEGAWFCAVHEEPGTAETVAFRADMDALPFRGGSAHLCGHDGHCAALAGLGLFLEHKKLGRNVVLLFQHAEETGAGGKICCQALPKFRVDRIYAFHNIPGWEEGTVLLRRGTFACASRGMSLSFTGRPSHAAYPESGCNPGFAAARFLCTLPAMTEPSRYGGLTMATLVGAKIGEKAFGCAAGAAEVWLTLRAWREEDMNQLIACIGQDARLEALRDGVRISETFNDVFPATVNDDKTLERLEITCRKAGLSCVEAPEPFRWSEDFGYYGSCAKAVMVGVGVGRDWPQLHTENYTFNDRILPPVLTMFSALARFG